MSHVQHKQLLSYTDSIKGAIEHAKTGVLGLRQKLAEAETRIEFLEAELSLHKEKAGGILSRDQFNNYYRVARGRQAFDTEWETFKKTFLFNTDDLTKRIMDWIEVMGPLINLGVLGPTSEEDPPILYDLR